LSKLIPRVAQHKALIPALQRSFRAAPQLSKKPSIGDAVTIL